MQPGDLSAKSFSEYPEQAKALAVANLALLRRLPLSMLPLLLGQIIDYDWRFPAEQGEVKRQLQFLTQLSSDSFTEIMAPFAAVQLPDALAATDWVNQPKVFGQQLSAFLWSAHQIDGYHAAAQKFQAHVDAALPLEPPATPRFAVVIIGKGAAQSDEPLFSRLRPLGTLFTNVKPENGLQTLLDLVNARSKEHPESYAHWYIDGGEAEPTFGAAPGVTISSYGALAPAIVRELTLMNQYVGQLEKSDAAGPEAVTSYIANMTPEDLGLRHDPADPVLEHFEASLLTEGAGTQIFSTTYVQWAARECLHRAQPLTLLARFQPRQRAATMNQMLSRDASTQLTDAEGSLVDADMGAYYTWINQHRLPGADQSRFLAWFEDHNLAIAIGPESAQGTTSDAATDIQQILGWM
jgi:hypothetical protein